MKCCLHSTGRTRSYPAALSGQGASRTVDLRTDVLCAVAFWFAKSDERKKKAVGIRARMSLRTPLPSIPSWRRWAARSVYTVEKVRGESEWVQARGGSAALLLLCVWFASTLRPSRWRCAVVRFSILQRSCYGKRVFIYEELTPQAQQARPPQPPTQPHACIRRH